MASWDQENPLGAILKVIFPDPEHMEKGGDKFGSKIKDNEHQSQEHILESQSILCKVHTIPSRVLQEIRLAVHILLSRNRNMKS